jgi:hypothetical protein
MSDEQQVPIVEEVPEVEQPNEVQQLKSEMSRKMQNQTQSMADLNVKLEALLQGMQKANAAPPESMRDALLDDPERAARMIEDRAVAKATAIVSNQTRQQQAAQNAVLEIQGKYSEFTQEGSEAGLLAIEKAAKLPDHLKGTPEGVRLAMMEAAMELGLSAGKKATPRTEADSFSASSQRTSSQQNRKADPAKDIDKRTLDFALLMDPTIANDPKRMEALKSASQRKKWNVYG